MDINKQEFSGRVHVLVYGTLLTGLNKIYGNIMDNAQLVGCALLDKAILYDIGNYPGIKEGDGIVIGEIFEINNEILTELDYIEGYDKMNEDISLYLRKQKEVTLLHNGEKMNVFAYFYRKSCTGKMQILHGDYRRYLLEKKTIGQSKLIASYGSNMSKERFKKRVGNINEKRKQGMIKNYSLIFNKDGYNGTGYANIIKSENDCPIVVDKLNDNQIQYLDLCEGVCISDLNNSHYLRIALPCYVPGLEQDMIQVYVAHPKRINFKLLPGEEYLKHIEIGYNENAFKINFT